jgi:hypothetical protein
MVVRLFKMTSKGPQELLSHTQTAEPLRAVWRDNKSFYLGLREWQEKSLSYYLVEVRKTGE